MVPESIRASRYDSRQKHVWIGLFARQLWIRFTQSRFAITATRRTEKFNTCLVQVRQPVIDSMEVVTRFVAMAVEFRDALQPPRYDASCHGALQTTSALASSLC